jgi:hypothetical protein
MRSRTENRKDKKKSSQKNEKPLLNELNLLSKRKIAKGQVKIQFKATSQPPQQIILGAVPAKATKSRQTIRNLIKITKKMKTTQQRKTTSQAHRLRNHLSSLSILNLETTPR